MAEADIGQLTAKGSLDVKLDLFLDLEDDSSIENLTLEHDADIWPHGKLTLHGTQNVWKSGNFKQGVGSNGALEIAEGATLNIPASDSDRAVEVPWVNYGTVDQTGTIAIVGEDNSEGVVTNHGQFNLSGDVSGTRAAGVLDVDGAILLEKDGTLTRSGSGDARIPSLRVDGGTLTIKRNSTLILDGTEWNSTANNVEIQQNGMLLLAPAPARTHTFSADEVITGTGSFAATNAIINLANTKRLSLQASNIRIENGFVEGSSFDLPPEERPKLILAKEAVPGIQPVVTLGTSDQSPDPLIISSVFVDNQANVSVERKLVLENTEFANREPGVLNVENASVLGGDTAGSFELQNGGGKILFVGNSTLGTTNDDILVQNGSVIVEEASQATIAHTLALSRNPDAVADIYTLDRGNWEVLQDGSLTVNGGQLIAEIGPDATVKLHGSARFNNLPDEFPGDVWGTMELDNGVKAADAGTIIVRSGGKLILNDSDLNASHGVYLEPGGVLTGRLHVTGDVSDSGKVEPGDSATDSGSVVIAPAVVKPLGLGGSEKATPGNLPGIAVIEGNYEQTATGSLEIQIGGPDPGTNYDQLIVSGTATLGGTLVLQPYNGFIPAPGQSFNVLVANSISGSFSNVVTEFGGRRTFDVALGPQGVMLTAQANAVTSFAQWQQAEFTAAELQDASVSGPNADPDGDGIVNFAEYALGLSAKVADSNPILPAVQTDPGTGDTILTLTFPWGDNMTDAQYQRGNLARLEDVANGIDPGDQHRSVGRD